MSAARRYSESIAPDPHVEGLPDRLQTYSRYVAVVAELLDAVRAREAVRMQQLTDEKRRLEAELFRPDADLPAPEAHELGALLETGLREVARRVGSGARADDHWISLQDGALLAARRLRMRAPRRGEYLTPIADTKLDVKL